MFIAGEVPGPAAQVFSVEFRVNLLVGFGVFSLKTLKFSARFLRWALFAPRSAFYSRIKAQPRCPHGSDKIPSPGEERGIFRGVGLFFRIFFFVVYACFKSRATFSSALFLNIWKARTKITAAV